MFFSTNIINTYYIDFVAGISEYGFKIEKIFRLIRKYKIKYFVLIDGEIPIYNNIKHKNVIYILFKIIIKPVKFIDILFCKLTTYFVKLEILYPKPDKVFAVQYSPILYSYINRINYDIQNIVFSNSKDYNSYLEFENNKKRKG